jgi:hypothetical protein
MREVSETKDGISPAIFGFPFSELARIGCDQLGCRPVFRFRTTPGWKCKTHVITGMELGRPTFPPESQDDSNFGMRFAPNADN